MTRVSYPESDVAIVGSGPNALALAAHLRALRVDFRIFGPPMKFWRDMPRGINLKSFAHATNVYVPAKGATFVEWCRARNLEDVEPCSMESFAAYGTWIKDHFVPNLEDVIVSQVAIGAERGFELSLANGQRLRSRRVVFATGLSNQEFVPEILGALPKELVSHTFHHSDYAPFRGRSVAVVGAGASAIEAGALVHEAGGHAQILVRDSEVVFHDRLATKRSLLTRLRYPMSVLGPGMKSRLMEELPLAVRLIPEPQRIRLVRGHLGPAAPWWIAERVKGHVPISLQTTVIGAEPRGDGVRLTLRDAAGERTLDVDHVIAGTGYVSDIDRLPHLDSGLRRRIQRIESAPTAPALSVNFESSVRGAYFVGPSAVFSFGPLFRFVAGAKYAAPALARHLAGPARTASRTVRQWAARASSALEPPP